MATKVVKWWSISLKLGGQKYEILGQKERFSKAGVRCTTSQHNPLLEHEKSTSKFWISRVERRSVQPQRRGAGGYCSFSRPGPALRRCLTAPRRWAGFPKNILIFFLFLFFSHCHDTFICTDSFISFRVAARIMPRLVKFPQRLSRHIINYRD